MSKHGAFWIYSYVGQGEPGICMHTYTVNEPSAFSPSTLRQT